MRSSLQKIYRALSLTLAICGTVALAAPPTDSYVVSLRRLTEQEYRNSIADIFGKEIEVRGTFEPTKWSNGLEAISSALLSVRPLEDFDTIGGYRTTENGETIDVSANIQGHSFSGAQGLGQYIHDNPQYPACVARKLYSYSRGVRSWSVKDFPDAYQAFQNSGFRMRALLKSMALSDSFYTAALPEKPSLKESTKVAKK
jgi:hypothetical protein